jgi:hypothetical protein
MVGQPRSSRRFLGSSRSPAMLKCTRANEDGRPQKPRRGSRTGHNGEQTRGAVFADGHRDAGASRRSVNGDDEYFGDQRDGDRPDNDELVEKPHGYALTLLTVK